MKNVRITVSLCRFAPSKATLASYSLLDVVDDAPPDIQAWSVVAMGPALSHGDRTTTPRTVATPRAHSVGRSPGLSLPMRAATTAAPTPVAVMSSPARVARPSHAARISPSCRSISAWRRSSWAVKETLYPEIEAREEYSRARGLKASKVSYHSENIAGIDTGCYGFVVPCAARCNTLPCPAGPLPAAYLDPDCSFESDFTTRGLASVPGAGCPEQEEAL